MSEQKFDELRTRLAEISDLGKVIALLSWDQQVMMPPRGAPGRAEQLATLGRIAHEKFTDPEIGKLLDELRDWPASTSTTRSRRASSGSWPRLGEGAQGADRAARRDVARGGPRASGLGRGATEQRLRLVPARAAEEPRSAQALHRVLRRGRRAVRRRARRLRARDEDAEVRRSSST